MFNRFGFMVIVVLSSTLNAAGAADQIGIRGDEVLDCAITRIEGPLSSYVPPRVGSVMRVDLARREFADRLSFRDGTMIPLTEAAPLRRTPPQDPWRSHQMFFAGRSLDANASAQLIVGAYGKGSDPLERRNWGARLQISHAKEGQEWSFAQVLFACGVAAP